MGKRFGIIAVLVLVVLDAGASHAQDGERPSITDARVYRVNDRVVGDLTSQNLFSPRVVGTVQSGLPAVVEVVFRVANSDRTIGEGFMIYELQYDVWEDRYTIRDVDTTRVYTSFEAMTDMVRNLRRIPLAPVAELQSDLEYTVQFSLAVRPLRSKDKREIQGWVSERVRGGTENAQRQQLLNINELIEHFFSRNKDKTMRSSWFRTAPFRPARLPVRED